MQARVLVVDDDPGIRDVLRGYLEREGYAVVEAARGEEALTLLASTGADVVLLDVGLPDLDGFEVLRRIRAVGETYVLLVTARVEEVDRLVGLGLGADDYVTKPFSPREVVARVKAVLRRDPRTAADSDRMAFDGFLIDRAGREVFRDGEPVHLTALEFDLLVTLALHAGRVLSRRQILEHLWGGDFFGDERVVDVHVRSLRSRLGDDAADPKIIGTVRGVGYKFLGTRG